MNGKKKKENKIKTKGCKRDVLPSPSVGRWFDFPPRCGVGGRSEAAAGSGGGGASRLAALAHLPLHHHLPGNAGDLTVCHHTGDPRPERGTKRES